MKTLITPLMVVLILAVLVSLPCFAVPPQRLDPAVADSLALLTNDPYEKADLYSEAWAYEKALAILLECEQDDSETLWRLARTRIDIGENIGDDSALPYYEKAMEEAQKAVDIDPGNALSQQTLAIACGRVALFKGVFKSLGLVKRVYAAAHRAIATGDSVPIAYYVLGRTHYRLAEKPGFIRKTLGIGWASEDSVAYYYEKAIEISRGNMIQCYNDYAEFLLDEKEDNEKAKGMLNAALALPLRDEHDTEARLKAKDLLKTL